MSSATPARSCCGCGCVRCADGSVELEIADDGVGFEAGADATGHYGLVGLAEQAEAIGAEPGNFQQPRRGHVHHGCAGRGTRSPRHRPPSSPFRCQGPGTSLA